MTLRKPRVDSGFYPTSLDKVGRKCLDFFFCLDVIPPLSVYTTQRVCVYNYFHQF